MDKKLRLKKNAYLILIGIVCLAIFVQIAHSQYILQFSHNSTVIDQTINGRAALSNLKPIHYQGVPYCIAYDETDVYSKRVKNNTEHVLTYMKYPVRSINLRDTPLSYQNCSAIIVTVTGLELIGDLDDLSKYVEMGGYVFFAVRIELNDAFYRLYRKIGINSSSTLIEAQGIILTSNILINEEALSINDSFILNTLNVVELNKESHVLATAYDGAALLWEVAFGKGRFMVFNGTMLQEKINRGLIAGAISMLKPDFIYPIFNSKLMYIDDFPAPIQRGFNAQISQDYNRDIQRFYRDIWWPDMIRAANKYNLKYTAVLIESYNDKVTPPFLHPLDEDYQNLLSYGREIIKSGGELGIHGYNHQSLQMEQAVADEYGYNAWNNMSDMSESVLEVLRHVKEIFPKYEVISYVPPSNILSKEGREALKNSWPELAVISSLYGEDISGISYVQEYEIAQDGILELPRITSGYSDRLFEEWIMANAITSNGIFSHFIHPDDLMDKERNLGMNWDMLYKSFVKLLERVDSKYPWLNSQNSSEASKKMIQFLTSELVWKVDNSMIQGIISPFEGEQSFIFRTSHLINSSKHCNIKKIDNGVYLVTAKEAEFEIGWKE